MAVFQGRAGADTLLDTPAQAMAHAIARMMESMGFSGGVSGNSGPVPPDGLPSAFGTWPSQLSPGGVMGQMGDVMTGAPTVLEGVWEDNQGGLLIVQGGLYRLYSAGKGYIEGDIRVTEGRIELGNRAGGFTQTFEFALDQGRLALRNTSGQLYLYRRLVLGRTP